jgi:hypothetical protein
MFNIVAQARDISLHHSIQTGSGAHPVSYATGMEGEGDGKGMKRPFTRLELMSRMVRLC